MLWIWEFILNLFLLLTTKSLSDSMYWDCSGKIFSILKSFVQESLVPVPIMILTIFFNILKILLLYEEFPQNIKP